MLSLCVCVCSADFPVLESWYRQASQITLKADRLNFKCLDCCGHEHVASANVEVKWWACVTLQESLLGDTKQALVALIPLFPFASHSPANMKGREVAQKESSPFRSLAMIGGRYLQINAARRFEEIFKLVGSEVLTLDPEGAQSRGCQLYNFMMCPRCCFLYLRGFSAFGKTSLLLTLGFLPLRVGSFSGLV